MATNRNNFGIIFPKQKSFEEVWIDSGCDVLEKLYREKSIEAFMELLKEESKRFLCEYGHVNFIEHINSYLIMVIFYHYLLGHGYPYYLSKELLAEVYEYFIGTNDFNLRLKCSKMNYYEQIHLSFRQQYEYRKLDELNELNE